MKKIKIFLIEYSAKREDGSRVTLSKEELCSCKDKGTAELIFNFLKNQQSFKNLCKNNDDYENNIFRLIKE